PVAVASMVAARAPIALGVKVTATVQLAAGARTAVQVLSPVRTANSLALPPPMVTVGAAPVGPSPLLRTVKTRLVAAVPTSASPQSAPSAGAMISSAGARVTLANRAAVAVFTFKLASAGPCTAP